MIVSTNAPFWNDLCDVVRLFYGDTPIASEGQDALTIRHTSSPGRERVELWVDGNLAAVEESAVEASSAEESLLIKRLRKRAAKNALYQLLKAHTGKSQAWGSLTGIRPSRVLREGMEELGDADAAVQWLQDVFDVPVNKAQRLCRMLEVQAGVPPPQPGECDVYVGIPFCTTRCSYCAFAAMDLKSGAPLVEGYLAALHRELEGSAQAMRQAGYRPRAVYVGGGTPTALTAAQLEGLLARLRGLFPEAYEWTVEAGRPDTVDREKLETLRAQGVGRISINPQSMNDATLRAIGRAHSADEVEGAFHLAREVGFQSINMDTIAALPGEGVAEMGETIRRVAALRPENVTLHTLAIKRASRLKQQAESPLPPVETAQAMFEGAYQALEAAEYQPYYLYRQKYMAGNLENIGMALPGHACLYNIDHMEEIAPILACGAGSISKWLYPRERRIERAPNLRDVRGYIERVDEMVRRKRALLELGEE